MSTYADDFQRTSLGANWRKLTGNPDIIAGQDLGIVSGGFILLEWTGGSLPADQFSRIVISGGLPTDQLARGVFVRRRASDGARYQLHYDDNGTGTDTAPQWQIKYDGVPTASARILAKDYVLAKPVAGDELEIRVEGNLIRGYLNGALILSATDSAITGAGTAGLASTGYGGTFTNEPAFASWAAGALTTTPPLVYDMNIQYDLLESTSTHERWRSANLNEAIKVEAYWRSGGIKPAVATPYGQFLVNTAEEIRR